MPTTYHGITLPIPSDLADGPKMGQDMVDTLTGGDAYKALDGGNAGPFRLFATTTARDQWTTRPNGALASVIADNTVYLYQDTAWVKLVPSTPPSVVLPAGVIYAYDGSGVTQAASIPGGAVNYILHNQSTGDTVNKNRTAMVAVNLRSWETTAAKPTQLSLKTRVTIGSTAHEQNCGYLSVYHTDLLSGSLTMFAAVTAVKATVTGASSVQIYVSNTGANAVGIRDLTVRVLEV